MNDVLLICDEPPGNRFVLYYDGVLSPEADRLRAYLKRALATGGPIVLDFCAA